MAGNVLTSWVTVLQRVGWSYHCHYLHNVQIVHVCFAFGLCIWCLWFSFLYSLVLHGTWNNTSGSLSSGTSGTFPIRISMLSIEIWIKMSKDTWVTTINMYTWVSVLVENKCLNSFLYFHSICSFYWWKPYMVVLIYQKVAGKYIFFNNIVSSKQKKLVFLIKNSHSWYGKND